MLLHTADTRERQPAREAWPELPYHAWKDTRDALHLFTQIVGKIRLAQTPWLNHGWHCALYVTCRGLTTSPIPHGQRNFQIDFDFIDHRVRIESGDGEHRIVPLVARSVADFRAELLDALANMELPVRIHGRPNEIPGAIPFREDLKRRPYDAAAVARFWGALLSVHRVLSTFRTGFVGKASPVHFFWGSFDLAVTRFSGRAAPPHPGGAPALPDAITREAYSHEVSSAGFWPGSGGVEQAAFYSYAYPMPEGFGGAKVEPREAFFHPDLGEFLLPYDVVRRAADPDATLLAFLQSTYERAADAGGWDRAALERPLGRPGRCPTVPT